MRDVEAAFFAVASLYNTRRRHLGSCQAVYWQAGEEYMVSRRELLSMAAATLAVPRLASAQSTASGKVALYANVGADLTHYDVDVGGMALTPRESVKLPASVQYAWPHASRRYRYVASSSSQPCTGPTGTEHHVT